MVSSQSGLVILHSIPISKCILHITHIAVDVDKLSCRKCKAMSAMYIIGHVLAR